MNYYPPVEQKICKMCKLEKNKNNFNLSPTSKSGLNTYCKACQSKISLERREAQKNKRCQNCDEVISYEARSPSRRFCCVSCASEYSAKLTQKFRQTIETNEKIEEQNTELSYRVIDTDPRLVIYKRDGFLCYYCGTHIHNLLSSSGSLDHIYPESLGGPNTASNLVTCCLKCNCKKQAKIELEILNATLKHVNSRNQEFGIPSDLRVKL